MPEMGQPSAESMRKQPLTRVLDVAHVWCVGCRAWGQHQGTDHIHLETRIGDPQSEDCSQVYFSTPEQ